LKPKKSLGQNFLADKNIQRKIIAASGFEAGDTVLEIGSGRGELTRLLADKVKKVYAVEIDRELCVKLQEEFGSNKKIKVIHQDILRFDLDKHIPGQAKIKVIGNIPYYLSSPIVEYLLKYRKKISAILITVQKEFGQRIAALPGSKDYGSFSCFVQYYCQPRILFNIKKSSFWPVPKVDSCLVRLEVLKRPPVEVTDEEALFKLIRCAFGQRRKTLRNSLKGLISNTRLELFFQHYHIDTNIRPEALSLEDFARLLNS